MTPQNPSGRDYYVTVRDGGRHGFLLGPFPTRRDALEHLQHGLDLAHDADPFAAFYAFGTSSVPAGTPVRVVLPNERRGSVIR